MDYTDEPHYLDALDDAFLVLDEAGTIAVWNSAAEDVTGYDGDELAELSVASLFTDGDRVTAAVSDAGPDRLRRGRQRVGAHGHHR